MQIRNLVATAIGNIQARFRFHQDVYRALSGNIAYGAPSTQTLNNTGQTVPQHCENIDGVLVVIFATPNVPNTEFQVIHNLNRVPQLLDIKRLSAAARIFDSGTPWTTKQIFLKCDTGNVKATLHIH